MPAGRRAVIATPPTPLKGVILLEILYTTGQFSGSRKARTCRRSCCHGIARWCRISVLAYAFEGKPKRGNSGLTASGVTLPQISRCDMITSRTTGKTAQAQGRFRLPDPPQREPDEMTQYDRLFKTGNSRYLALHLGSPETTLVEADRWIVPDASFNKARARRPDLLVAFDVHPALYKASNGYIVSEQGKPPDFVLEVASESTAEIDVGDKRRDYAALGIPEYWRFDESGEHHGAWLAGDRLADGVYVPIDIEELPGGSLQGNSPVLKPEHPVGGRRVSVLRSGHGPAYRHPGR